MIFFILSIIHFNNVVLSVTVFPLLLQTIYFTISDNNADTNGHETEPGGVSVEDFVGNLVIHVAQIC